MHTDHLRTVALFDRYREIVTALALQGEAWDDGFWRRFAAQVVVMCPGEPAALARSILSVAQALHERTPWYRSLASPARFTVAAMLIQHHVPVTEFLTESTRAGNLFSAVGLRHSGFYQTMAILILRLSPQQRPLSLLTVERLRAIYDQMKHFHWWLTGPHDLPACAALAQCPGVAVAVVARVEDMYQQLLASGLVSGTPLLMVANLLPLIADEGEGNAAVVRRYGELSAAFATRFGVFSPEHYDALMILTILDHPADRTIARLVEVRDQLDAFQRAQRGRANLLIAADLVFLDLVRFDRDLPTISQKLATPPHAAASMLAAIHVFHIATAVMVSQLDANQLHSPEEYAVMAWLYPSV